MGNYLLPVGKEEPVVKKRVGEMAAILLPLLLLTGCGPIGEKQTSISVIYGALAVAALLMLL
jgi:hypothetical protein